MQGAFTVLPPDWQKNLDILGVSLGVKGDELNYSHFEFSFISIINSVVVSA